MKTKKKASAFPKPRAVAWKLKRTSHDRKWVVLHKDHHGISMALGIGDILNVSTHLTPYEATKLGQALLWFVGRKV